MQYAVHIRISGEMFTLVGSYEYCKGIVNERGCLEKILADHIKTGEISPAVCDNQTVNVEILTTEPVLHTAIKTAIINKKITLPPREIMTAIENKPIINKPLPPLEIMPTEESGEIDEEQLIAAVNEREPLWNFRLPLKARSKPIKDKLWEEVSLFCNGHDVDKIKTKPE